VNVYKKHKTTGVETLVYTMNYSGVNPFVSNDIALPNLPDFVYTIQATIPDLSSSSLVQQFRDFSFVVNAAKLTGSEPFTVKPRFNPSLNLPLGDFSNVGFNHGYPANPHAIGLGAYRIVLSTLGVDEVISDQIMDNDANKLPTAAYGGQPNNPMLMATRTGNDARLKIRMNPFAPLASKLLVAVREVVSGTIKGSTVPQLNPAPTPLVFSATDGRLEHEIVSGQDLNGNGTLETSEVKSIFEKTPRLKVGGAPYDGNDTTFKHLDKFYVVTQNDFFFGKTECQTYGSTAVPFYPNAAEILYAFANGADSVPSANTEYNIPLNANAIGSTGANGLSLPLGARWDSSNQALTHRLVYPSTIPNSGSSPFILSNRVLLSNTMRAMLSRVVSKNKASITAAATSNFSNYTLTGVVDNDLAFKKYDPGSDVFYTLGNCKFIGDIVVRMRAVPGGFEVSKLSIYGSIYDLYDFALSVGNVSFGPIVVNLDNASTTQAGMATLNGNQTPNTGRVFYTKVDIDYPDFYYSAIF
jgi:hypothetical protein